MRNKAIIIGAGTYAEIYSQYLSSGYDVVGFYDDNEEIHGKVINDILVIGSIRKAKEYVSAHHKTNVFIPLGNNELRFRLFNEFVKCGALTPNFIHPSVIIDPTVKLGRGVYILPSSSIMPFSSIGDFTMISMGVNIAHHTKIGEACFFSQGTNVGASIIVEDLAYCGIASTIMTGVKCVGKNSLIGAGAVVIRDVKPNSIVAGVPAKLLKYKAM
ncbi:MAG: NeuD/PglB/VioB family sugar acetyltransferase [Porphyromonas sp.]|nr:NeuD/PglB/VioB family sugar acetyltransferase [Porphyromonas sp.]